MICNFLCWCISPPWVTFFLKFVVVSVFQLFFSKFVISLWKNYWFVSFSTLLNLFTTSTSLLLEASGILPPPLSIMLALDAHTDIHMYKLGNREKENNDSPSDHPLAFPEVSGLFHWDSFVCSAGITFKALTRSILCILKQWFCEGLSYLCHDTFLCW